jgi:hypothetical protein
MFAHQAMRPAGSAARGSASIRGGLGALAAGCVLLATACTAPPPAPLARADPADPGARVPPAAYRSVTGSYRSQRPVEPRAWDEQNERVAPAPKQ